MKVRATEYEILIRLNHISTEKGVALTYAHKLFFLKLLKYAENLGSFSYEGLSIALSVQELSKALEVPLRTTIQSLKKLVSCGALERRVEKKTFPRSVTITVIPKNMYDKEIDYETND